jgi:pyruvate ferredoxin oxidoreductase alpha subunit
MKITKGQTDMTYDTEAKNKRVPLGDWLKYMGKSKTPAQG